MNTNQTSTLFEEYSDRVTVRVSFRESTDKEFKGEITAVFLSIPAEDGMLSCYSHDGRHGLCQPDWVRKTKPARSYAELRRELESIGYDVTVQRKMAYPKQGQVICHRCGAKIKPDKEAYERVCREEDRNVGPGFKRMSLEEWAIKNHDCKIKSKKK